MRLTAALLFLTCMQVSANSFSQEISISRIKAPLESVFHDIEKQSSYQFFYKVSLVPQFGDVTVNLHKVSLQDALDEILKDYPGLSYLIIDKTIVIRPKEDNDAIYALPEVVSAVIDITGVVRDKTTGEPLAGVSIKVRGSSRGTMTQEGGVFSLKGIDENAELEVSYIGYEAQIVKVAGRKEINISLQMNNNTLEETIVTGYQAFTNRTAPGVIAKLKPQDLTQVGAVSLDQMLDGKIAGMVVTGNVGNPGAPPKIRIRGTSSITGDQEPIWVIDGVIWEEAVPVRNRDLATLDEVSLLTMIGSAVAGLNPKDIESINILKDAAATAIYGVRAANGVIVVTTKRGHEGAPRINYSSDFKTSLKPTYADFQLMNSLERVQLSQDIINSGLNYPIRPGRIGFDGAYMDLRDKNITQEEFDEKIAYYAGLNTDWFDILFRNSFSQNHNLSISGGAGKTTYYFSASMYDEKGNARESNLKRYTASSRLNMQVRNNLSFDIKVGANIRENKGYHSTINPFNYATTTSRALPAYNPDGSLAYYDKKNSVELNNPGPLEFNILNEIAETGNESKTREMNAQLAVRWSFLKHFQYEGTAFYATSSTNVDEWATERSYHIAYNYRGYKLGLFDNSHPNVDNFAKIPIGGILKPYRTNNDNYTFRNALTFNKNVSKKGNLNAMLGTEIRSVRQKGLTQMLPGYFPERGGMFTIPTTTAYKNAVSSRDPLLAEPKVENTISNFVSVYAALIYNHDNKYIFNANGRFDGSNNFGKDPKYRYLPTFSTAFKWIASEENFLSRLTENNTIDFMALNASFGLQGNIKSNAYPTLVTKVNNIDRFGNTVATVVSLGNPGLRWEQTYSYNLGLEFGLFNRFNFRADYYRKNGIDLLINKLVSQVEGRETILLNAGDMYNQGIELTLSGYVVRNRYFTWRSSFVGANNKNKITKAYVGEADLNSQLNGSAVTVGEALGTIYAFQFAGLDNQGVPLYYTNNKNQEIARSMDPLDRKTITVGSLNPKLNGGWDNNFRYKDFTLVVSLTYNLGSYKRLPPFYGATSPTLPYPEQNFSSEYLKRWRQPGDEAHTNIPVLMDQATSLTFITSGGYDNPILIADLYNNSDLRVVKTNYMRVRAINLQYHLPAKLTRRVGASSATIYGSAQNLWYITSDRDKMNGIDPEVIGERIAMPLPKIFNFGVNISF
ncbi:MAG TPA: SusC/RagA family TonB-linked outer membrane protein [Parasegetibacter sp.]